MEDVQNLLNTGPTNPIWILNQLSYLRYELSRHDL